MMAIPIKIPKVTTSTVKLYCNKSDVEAVGTKGYEVTLKSQVVAGYKIPAGIRFFNELLPNSAGVIVVEGERVNALLKMLYLNDLRNRKNIAW